MRRLLSRFVLAGVSGALALLSAAPASAYEVRITITGAGTVTESTPADLVGNGCTTASNTPTGAVGDTCLAGSPSGDYGWNWDVDYVATPKPGYRFVRWESDGTTRPGIICDRSSPPATTTTHTGSTCKFRTPYDLQTRAVFEDVTNPAMSSLTGPNSVVNGAATFTFSAAADPTFRMFECRVGGVHDWQTCSSGRQENPPSSGTYTFQVRAVDWSGNWSSESTWTWNVDKVAPTTGLAASGPSGTVASTSATFSFSSNEAGTFRCTLDGVQATCGSPKTYSGLAQGQHTFAVQAVDVAGNVDPTPETRTWTVDTVAPDTQLTSAPAALTRSGTASFEYTATDSHSAFVCTLDGTGVPCTSSYVVTDGQHTFTVAARDAAGNVDPSPASHTWTVDTVAPRVTSKSPTGKRVSTRSNVVVRFSEAMREAVLEASRSGKPRAITLSLGRTKVAARVTYTETAGGAFRAVLDPAKRLKAGKRYTVAVTARPLDLAGNAVAPTSWRFRTKG